MSKLNELLESEAGRKALMDAIPRLFLHDEKRRGAEPSIEEVPIDRIAWCADHRVNGVPADVVDNLKTPVNLNRVFINGDPLYLVADGGNHRIERFVEAGRKTILAEVHDWDLEPASLKKGVVTEYRLDKPSDKGKIFPNNDITPAEADLLKSLNLVKDETVPAPTPTPTKKRRIFGFGIGD